MAVKSNNKRKAQPTQGASKKRKISKDTESKKPSSNNRDIIPIPAYDEDIELSDEDLDAFEDYGDAVGFLSRLDEKGIARSKKETERLHRLHKPVHEDDWGSSVGDDTEDEEEDLADAASAVCVRGPRKKPKAGSDEEEMSYETIPRKRRPSWDPEEKTEKGVERLPIKLSDGRIQKSKDKVILDAEETEENEDYPEEDEPIPEYKVEDVSTGARFGRPAVVDVIGNKSRKARIQGAKEQLAGICQEIVAEPENSIGLLRRLHTFSLPEISTPSHPEPIPNDPVIRKLTVLSQLAVFKDIIPGYRIRALTDIEKSEKVSQMVQRTRDWEQGLVTVYQNYLRVLEAEIKAKNDLAETALQCMCSLLVELTHFNFRVNLMNCVVAYLSKKSWDPVCHCRTMSDLCLNSLIKVFRGDNTGDASLEIVRLLNRMIKERKFNVHPDVLSCLLYLRLKTELGVRASETRADKDQPEKVTKKAKNKKAERPHLSKKAKKVFKEKKEIAKEMREAEAEVDKEERAAKQTETLKLLFVLYFRILKNPTPTPLLPAALQGISKFSHLVNIDFFRDLLQVLKGIIRGHGRTDHDTPDSRSAQYELLCIVTAFELLSGQGEALDIDLGDFVHRLYAILPALSMAHDVETVPAPSTTADMLFRALHLVFTPRVSLSVAPPWRAAALTAIELVGVLVERDPKLEALLSTEDRGGNGLYRPDLDDPQLSNPFGTTFWELHVLAHRHLDARVRTQARKVLHSTS
ncbi:nucleolar complex-associated protein-domain-containing protein [Fomitopsis serialis]|uniref:nucleolar complex-associated protein-domain-containing protein n=1 Tax=Fomitopsis serialis TaxID=139415 RepID=UPI0020086B8C|nr:nucleolar complex-associated protein-domain-containing protein [Neoantrodia serialis]KAH9934778.1 nucleolar complex-associated protein-domain-containing protein [Neoantrodia serialis]